MPSNLSIVICINRRLGDDTPSCAAAGSEQLANELEQLLEKEGMTVPIKRVECLGQCEKGPNLRLVPGGRFFHHLSRDDFPEVIAELKRMAVMHPK